MQSSAEFLSTVQNFECRMRRNLNNFEETKNNRRGVYNISNVLPFFGGTLYPLQPYLNHVKLYRKVQKLLTEDEDLIMFTCLALQFVKW